MPQERPAEGGTQRPQQPAWQAVRDPSWMWVRQGLSLALGSALGGYVLCLLGHT